MPRWPLCLNFDGRCVYGNVYTVRRGKGENAKIKGTVPRGQGGEGGGIKGSPRVLGGSSLKLGWLKSVMDTGWEGGLAEKRSEISQDNVNMSMNRQEKPGAAERKASRFRFDW